MLVITRKAGETFHVGDDVVVTVVRVADGTVRIGIDAPSHVSILRGELVSNHCSRQPKALACVR